MVIRNHQEGKMRRHSLIDPMSNKPDNSSIDSNFWPATALVILLLQPFTAPCALTAERQPPEQIEQAAENHLYGILASEHDHVEVTARGVDSRLNLSKCSGELEPFIPHGRDALRASTVGVSCAGEETWTVYVRMEIKISAAMVVAAHPLSRGTTLQGNDLNLAIRDVRRTHGNWYTNADEVIGLETLRNIRQGDPITSRTVDQPLLIGRGDRVTIQAGADRHISITTHGKAQEDGRKGETIRVENLDSGREIEAQVVGSGVVRVDR